MSAYFMALIAHGHLAWFGVDETALRDWVLLFRNVLAAIFKAMVALLLVGSRPCPMIFLPDAIVGTQPQPGNVAQKP